MEDRDIVELYLSRDQEALRQTSEKYGGRLRSLAFHLVEDDETAEECENDTYLAAWQSIPPHEPRDYFYPFLARLLRHIALNRCRERKRLKRSALVCELSSELEECLAAPDDTECRVEAGELAQTINDFLGSLPAAKRIVFLRRYWYLDSVAEIGTRCAMSQGQVKTMLYRLRSQLRDYLEKEGFLL